MIQCINRSNFFFCLNINSYAHMSYAQSKKENL